METINNLLHFLNYLDFVADFRSDDYSNFNHIIKVSKDNFQDVDSEQLIHMLVVDDIRIPFLRQDFNEVNPLTESLRENFHTIRKENNRRKNDLTRLNVCFP